MCSRLFEVRVAERVVYSHVGKGGDSVDEAKRAYAGIAWAVATVGGHGEIRLMLDGKVFRDAEGRPCEARY